MFLRADSRIARNFLEVSVAKHFRFLVIAICICGLASLGWAQVATTSLHGVVRDPSGAVIPGAKVTLTDTVNHKSLTATADSTGTYNFEQITPSTYTITVSTEGFATQTKEAELLVNQPATISFTMSVKASKQVVNVSAEAQSLNTTNAELGAAMNNRTIQALPSETRNVPDLLSLQPGVLYLPQQTSTPGDSRSGVVNGVRSDQSNVTTDGINDNGSGNQAFSGVLRETQDSIEEFRVTTGNGTATAGYSAGAQVSMVTKSGTNKFHGAAYWYNRPTNTVANNWFNKQAELNSGLSNIPGKLIRNIFGADLGGPIIRNKLYFFANYEGLRKSESQQVTETVPTKLYRQGYLSYQDVNGNTVTLDPNQVAALDAGCQVCNTSAYPYGPGPDPEALKYFNSMPLPNGRLTGDGLNTASYSFASPAPHSENTTLAKIDWTPNASQHVFVRGQLQKDTTDNVEQFPGQGPSSIFEDNTKGLIAGDTWVISPNLVNDLRYGYIRQGSSSRGVGSGDYVNFRFMSTATAETRTAILSVPTHNIVDNLNWNHGKHNFEFGATYAFITQNRSSDANSYQGASSNPYWLGGNPIDPSTIGQPSFSSGFGNSYNIALANLLGTVPEVDNIYNYQITSPTAGSLLADGAFITRHYRSQELEYYLQDTWRPTAALTIIFGIRHTLLGTPWETSGQEITPTIDTHTWYLKRESEALKGQIYEPNLDFSPTGPYYGKPGYYPMRKNDFAPRVSIAYALGSKTSIRAGFGIYFDHFGQSLVNTFDQNGSYGVSSGITNPAGLYGYETAPRFVGRNQLPFNNGTPPATTAFPYAPPSGGDGFAITWGLDSQMKTPYTESFDASFERILPHGFSLEVSYTGTLGRHLLQALDLANPVDFVDTKGGGDYYHAGTELSKEVDANGGNSFYSGNGQLVNVSPIKYFEDVFPWMANFDYPGENATTAIYNNEWAPYRAVLGATTALSDLDFYGPIFGFYPAPANWQPHYWQSQFSSLYALSAMGMSYYNGLQVTLKHPFANGLETSISYTYSHSIDEGSDAERNTEFSNSNGSFSSIEDTWKPQLNRGSSDFDTRHLLTGQFVYQLPFGAGRQYLATGHRLVNFFVGDWQLSGIARVSSGLPFTVFEPGWTTNWQQEAYGVVTGKVKVHKHYDNNGSPQFFADPSAINNGISTGSPIRIPYPGEAGERNNFRGDGYFDIDSGLDKTWGLPYGNLKFSWEVYNVTNSVRFDPGVDSLDTQLTDGSLGIASATLTQSRRMQFALRYGF